MPTPTHEIFSIISAYTRNIEALRCGFLGDARRDIDRLEELTNASSQVLRNQATATLIAGFISAACICAASAAAAAAPSPAPANPRLGANAGIGDMLSNGASWVGDRLKDKSTFEAGTRLSEAGSKAFESYSNSLTNDLRARQELMKYCVQEKQGGKAECDRNVRSAQDQALSIIQAKSKEG